MRLAQRRRAGHALTPQAQTIKTKFKIIYRWVSYYGQLHTW
jgi:hypothetical protein